MTKQNDKSWRKEYLEDLTNIFLGVIVIITLILLVICLGVLTYYLAESVIL
jgi:hypothetical protein